MSPGCTCGATLKHSADCVIFWESLPRTMLMGDLCDWSYLPLSPGFYDDRVWATAADYTVECVRRCMLESLRILFVPREMVFGDLYAAQLWAQVGLEYTP